jgi:tripartite-type tricarboxylate transporter receptor subunit TctC
MKEEKNMQPINRRTAAIAIAALPLAARAQSRGQFKPTRPVKMVSPLQAGGATDAIVRPIAQRLADLWGQPVVVDNKPGGGTVIGTLAVVQSPPDGYTFGVCISALTINPSLRNDLPYDTFRDITPVAQIGSVTSAIVAHPSFAPNNLKDVIALAKDKPGSLSWASLGIGTGGHITGELIAKRAGLQMTHVPFAGSAGAYRELLPGRIPFGFVVLESALQHVKSGKLKLIAVTDRRRSKLVPDTPTVDETMPGMGYDSIFGFIAPGNLPPDVLKALHADINQVLALPEVREQLERQSMAVDLSPTPQDFAATIRRDVDHWKSAVKESGARVS